jgi:SAM-dependent methyltransferase
LKSHHRYLKRERAYKSKVWGIPYSEEYWIKFVEMKEVSGPTLEVGCGEHGLWRYNSKVMGLDPLDYSSLGPNFTLGKAEELPFPDGSFTDVICINSLDHMMDPKKAIDEMIRVSSDRVITWTYIFPNRLVGLLYFGHPWAFKLKSYRALFPSKWEFTHVNWLYPKDLFSPYAKGAVEKLKLEAMDRLDVRALLLHWRKNAYD